MKLLKGLLLLSVVAVISLFSIVIFADSGLNSPTSCRGAWKNCNYAFSDGSGSASLGASGNSKAGTWNGYGFSIPDSAIINSVMVKPDFSASGSNGYARIFMSPDGGATWGQGHIIGGNTAEKTFDIDVTNDFSWTPVMVNSIKVNATCFKQGGGKNPTCYLDWLPVAVTYTLFDFSLSISPTFVNVAQGRANSTTVTVAIISGSSQNADLSYEGCPPYAVCTFTPAFGNPSYASIFNVSTSVSTPSSIYRINITGTGGGITKTASYTLNVSDRRPFAFPSASPASGTAPLAVNFTVAVFYGDPPLTYFWDFKDGSNSTLKNVQHTYTAAGTYNAAFTVTDYDGDFVTESVTVTVF